MPVSSPIPNVLDALFAFVGVMTPDGILIEANRAPLDAAGIRKQDVIGKPFWEAYWWSYSPAVQQQLRDAIARARNGEPSRYDVDVRMKDGQLTTIDFMLTPMRDDDGRITHLIPSAVPITERKQAEQALARQLNLTLAITNNATTALFIMDHKQHCVFMNPAAEQLSGYTLDEVKGRPLHDFVHHTRPDGRPCPLEECPIDHAFLQNDKTKGEEIFVHKDGSFYEVAFTASPMRTVNGVVGTVIEVQNITERKRREAERRRTERLLDAVLDALPVSIIIADRDGRLIRMNAASQRIWGPAPTTESAAEYGKWVGFHAGTERRVEAHEWPLSRAVLKGETVAGEIYEIERFDTRARLILSLSAAPVRDENGAIIGGVVACMDVTERVRAEDEIRANEAILNAVLDALPVGVVIGDKNGAVVRDNAAHRELWGMEPGAGSSPDYGERVGYWPETGKRIDRHEWAMSRALLNGEVVKGELVESQPFGSSERRVFLNNAAPIRDGHGAITAAVVAQMDVTERMRVEEEFRTLANAIPQLCWMARHDGHIFWYNQRWYEYTGTTPEQMEGWGWRRVHDPEVLPEVMERWTAAIRNGEHFEMVFPLRGADGVFRPFLTRIVPVRDGSGRVARWFGTNTDISAQKSVEAELRRANQDLEQFAFSASHDLQEPLRNVAIYSQLIAKRYRDKLDEQGQEFLGYMIEGAQRMSQLVSDLLAYTQAAGLDDAPLAPVDSGDVLDQVLWTLRPVIEQTRARILRDQLPLVCAKQAHLQQLFLNVVGNAVKYRKEAEAPLIRVSATRQNAIWQFSVADNGIGIDPAFHQRIFGIFKRLHGRHGRYSGTGIGLAICKRIVERYGGRIWVESAASAGSTFHFTLPAAGEK